MNFYTTVVVVAASILVLCLIGMGVIMNYNSKKKPFPPEKSACPDRWKVSGNVCLIPSSSEVNPNIGLLKEDNNQYLPFIQDTHGISDSIFTDRSLFINPVAGNSSINFNDEQWSKSASSTTCSQYAWATKYGITWDGITNYNGC